MSSSVLNIGLAIFISQPAKHVNFFLTTVEDIEDFHVLLLNKGCVFVGETRYALSEEAYVSPLLWVTAHAQ